MAKKKLSDFKKMSQKDREKKLKDLKVELTKFQANASKSGSSKIKETKKMIARLLTLNQIERLNNK